MKKQTGYILCKATDIVYMFEYVEDKSDYTVISEISKQQAKNMNINYMEASMINFYWKKQQKILQIKW